MRIRRLEIALILILGTALIASAGVIFHQSRKLAETRQQRDQTFKSLQDVRDALRQAELRLATTHETPKPMSSNKGAIAHRDATIKQLSAEITAAQASIADFQEKLSQARDDNKKALAKADQRYQKLQEDWQNRVDTLQTELKSAQADVQSSKQRITDLERENAKLQTDSSTHSTRTAERERILASLQDLDRRRESYLTSIAERYRNITSQFRTMTGMLDSSHGQQGSNAFSGAALDLIQNTISLADNDLHHLSELNAKAFRLEKRLSKK